MVRYNARKAFKILLLILAGITNSMIGQSQSKALKKAPFVPSNLELNRPFGQHDMLAFNNPPKVDYPETYFHFIGGNISKQGITADLEAVAKSGITGIRLFNGQFGGAWPGVQPQITCLSPEWDDAVKYSAQECKRLGLNFVMNNTPGWATSGGPWIKPDNSMRDLIWSRKDITGGNLISEIVPVPKPSSETWRDYKDITLLAFPTPKGDSGIPFIPKSANSDNNVDWLPCFSGERKGGGHLEPCNSGQNHWIEVTFPKAVTLRTIELPSILSYNSNWCYEPGIDVTVQAVLQDGNTKEIAKVKMPASNFQDDKPFTLACSEAPGAIRYRIVICNKHDMAIRSIKLYSAARKNNWESEAAWTLRGLVHSGDPQQSPSAYINPDSILDISDKMGKNGRITWNAPKGNWTILRFGHVNSGKKNSPAPREATGWEANKLASSGADAHFAGYIGRLSGKNGPLSGGLMDGVMIDSWECGTQSWTDDMEIQFRNLSNYSLRSWLPALVGYVVKDNETTTKFLDDWRKTINYAFTNNFYGRMSALSHVNGLHFTFETAAGDVFPGDIMEYFKYADVPMCEFWQPLSDNFVGSINFKPLKPTVSAARMYGKPRIAAESFTSFELTWDEHFEMLREVVNVNAEEGITHFVLHTYTHNPQKPFLPPGTSFGTAIGTPFLRGQTWWPYMSDFNKYLARCTYMLERGKPVSDVLWYLGDELDHKPDQNASFPEGYKYDYCNKDVLLHRLTVVDKKIVTPEGITYSALWLPKNYRMLPATLKKLFELVQKGATIIGEPPVDIATLSGGNAAKSLFNVLVQKIWGDGTVKMRKIGLGLIVTHMTIENALTALNVKPDLIGGDALWLHRKIDGADWYFVSAPKGKAFKGDLSFKQRGNAELWDPVTGSSEPIRGEQTGERTSFNLAIEKSNAFFVVFRHKKYGTPAINSSSQISSIPMAGIWNISFPTGWGAPTDLITNELKSWKDLDLSPEGKAFSGTATYKTNFYVNQSAAYNRYELNLGNVNMVASVVVNGHFIGNLLAPPYRIDLKNAIKPGKNELEIKVTSTWFNRLVFDAGQPEEKRKTWVISGPAAGTPLRSFGLIGPVTIHGYTTIH